MPTRPPDTMPAASSPPPPKRPRLPRTNADGLDELRSVPRQPTGISEIELLAPGNITNAPFVSPPITGQGDPLAIASSASLAAAAAAATPCTASASSSNPPPTILAVAAPTPISRPRGQIDHTAFPDIMDSILGYASWGTLCVVRCTSKTMRDKVLTLQNSHVVFCLTPPPNVITAPHGLRIPSFKVFHDNEPPDMKQVAGLFDTTRLIDVHGSPHEHGRPQVAVDLAFAKRDVVLRFHPTHHAHDISVPVAARKVVFFGSSMTSKWAHLPPPEQAQEKTVVCLKTLNNPANLKTVFRRFPPAAGAREAVLVFTHWGSVSSYTVPPTIANLINRERLARERLSVISTLAAGLVLGGWLFPDMPPVTFTVVDFPQVRPQEFALSCGAPASAVPTPLAPATTDTTLTEALAAAVTAALAEMVGSSAEAASKIVDAKSRLRLMTRDEYGAAVLPQELELDTVEMRHGHAFQTTRA